MKTLSNRVKAAWAALFGAESPAPLVEQLTIAPGQKLIVLAPGMTTRERREDLRAALADWLVDPRPVCVLPEGIRFVAVTVHHGSPPDAELAAHG